jgi:hypothetical protein
MTRINSSGTTGPQPIQSQGGTQQVSKTQTEKTQQDPNAAEQQQSKQAAQGRKSDIDLQGTIKQSELAQFHGPGRLHGGGKMDPCNGVPVDDNNDNDLKLQDAAKAVVAGAVAGGPGGALAGSVIGGVPQLHGERRETAILEGQMKKLNEMWDTRDPISGQRIIDLEADKDDQVKAKELLNEKNSMSDE